MKNFDSTWPVRFSLLFFFLFIFKVSAQQKDSGLDERDVIEELATLDPLTEFVPEILEDKKDSPVSTFLLKERLKLLEKEIPLRYNEYSHNYVDFFAVRRSSFTQRMLETKDLYFPIFEEMLAKHNLPEELKYLSLIESGLNPRIVSRAGAGGLWQFMRATGREFGLLQNSYIDERFHPEKSTEAACRYLKQLYKIFGDWEMVLAAYNCGPGNVRRAIRRTGRNDFWGIYHALPRETRNYVPQYVAMVYMMHYAQDHGIVASEQKLLPVADTINVKGYLNLRTFAELSGMTIDDIYEHNPHIVGTYIPASNQGITLKVPAVNTAMVKDYMLAILDSSSRVPASHGVMLAGETRKVKDGYEIITTSVRHSVKSGQTLSGIASRYGTTVAQLKNWNNLKSNNIRVGQRLVIQQTVRRRIQEEAPKPKPVEVAEPQVILASLNTSAPEEVEPPVNEEDVESLIDLNAEIVQEETPAMEETVPEKEVTLIPELPAGTVMTEEIFLARQAARLEQLNKQKEVTKAASSVEMKKMNPATGNPPAKSSPKNSTIEHTVQKGETLYSIARKYRVTVSDLIDANQLNGTTLKVGKILVILTDKAKSSTGQQNPIYHVVQKGDTLWDISRKYGLSVDKIKKVNNIKGNSLKTGMKILISG